MGRDWLGKIRRGLKKPPRYILGRVLEEIRAPIEKHMTPIRTRAFSTRKLLALFNSPSLDQLWSELSARPYLAPTRVQKDQLERLCPGETARILAAAEAARAHRVDLLGSGPIDLGREIDWHKDYKTGIRWEPQYCRDIEYSNLDRPSDVKFPWEVSRMQWMIPLGQAYLLTGDQGYALETRELLDSWMAANPHAHSVNWACTMDVALRIITWTWFFHVFHGSPAWAEPGFRQRFLKSLYLHGDFTTRHLEKSDVSGNHYTSDAAGLVFAGLFFGGCAESWLELGWSILSSELPLQVYPDGVDFEASVPYHRLVQELFLFPALYRLRQGREVPDAYRQRLLAMARFTAAYSRNDGSLPLWGDADDARTLPFGGQPLNDHRYLLGITGLEFGETALLTAFSGSRSESFWLQGFETASRLPDRAHPEQHLPSAAFPDGGFYILRNRADHLFVDCGPLGLGNRGGHGHNDLLSFELALEGALLLSDCGAYLYTADFKQRNLFRSTAYHNTPQLDGEELNRFVDERNLWSFHYDAKHLVRQLEFAAERDLIEMSHSGYQRLPNPVTVARRLELHHSSHLFKLVDQFQGTGEHRIEIPLHLALGCEARPFNDRLFLVAAEKTFEVTWQPHKAWTLKLEPCRISPSYGVTMPSTRLSWHHQGNLIDFHLEIRPVESSTLK